MIHLTYYTIDPATHNWEQVKQPGIYQPTHPLYYAEIRLYHHSDIKWTSTIDVLTHLLHDAAIRKRILSKIASARTTRRSAIQIVHPLLKIPLYLRLDDQDQDFCYKIRNYILMETPSVGKFKY